MRHAVHQRISLTGRDRLEHGACDVPLEQMDAAARGARQVDELVGEETLARARQPGEEDHALSGEGTDALGEPAVGVDHHAGGVPVGHVRAQAITGVPSVAFDRHVT